MKLETLKLIFGLLIVALGISFACILIVGADVVIDQNGHITIEAWRHPFRISVSHYYDCSDLGNDGWWPKVDNEKKESKELTDVSGIVTAEKVPDDSPLLMTIKVNKNIATGIEGIRLRFIGGVTIESTEETPNGFLFHIPKSSGIKVDSPFHIQYKKDGKWQSFEMPLLDSIEGGKQDDSQPKAGIMI